MPEPTLSEAMRTLYALAGKGALTHAILESLTRELLRTARISNQRRCYFCNGPAYPWKVSAESWQEVEPLLGTVQEACSECFAAAAEIMGLTNGKPLEISIA